MCCSIKNWPFAQSILSKVWSKSQAARTDLCHSRKNKKNKTLHATSEGIHQLDNNLFNFRIRCWTTSIFCRWYHDIYIQDFFWGPLGTGHFWYKAVLMPPKKSQNLSSPKFLGFPKYAGQGLAINHLARLCPQPPPHCGVDGLARIKNDGSGIALHTLLRPL